MSVYIVCKPIWALPSCLNACIYLFNDNATLSNIVFPFFNINRVLI